MEKQTRANSFVVARFDLTNGSIKCITIHVKLGSILTFVRSFKVLLLAFLLTSLLSVFVDERYEEDLSKR